jgi:hypothetical protein
MNSLKIVNVVKKPRTTVLPDVPINFPQLPNLHLELLEIKEKLKPGLPLIPRSKGPVANAASLPTHDDLQRTRKQPHAVKKKKIIIIDEEITKATDKPKALTIDIASDKKSRHDGDNTKKKVAKMATAVVAVATAATAGKHKKKSKVDDDDDEVAIELGESDSENESTNDSGGDDSEGDSDADDEDDDVVDSDDDEGEEKGDEEPSKEEPAVEEPDDPLAHMTPEEREAYEKEEYLWRFRILKKQYGKTAVATGVVIPDYNEHSDLPMMKRTYERTIRELYLDDAVETYKTYLVGGWIVMEYVCTQFIEIDLAGFTIQQTKMMYKYERMLIELGEKSYTRWGMNLPVEVRLIGMILLQAGLFYLAKIISNKFGQSTAEMFRGFTGQPPPADANANGSTVEEVKDEDAEAGGKTMKGPKVKAADIRKKATPATPPSA